MTAADIIARDRARITRWLEARALDEERIVGLGVPPMSAAAALRQCATGIRAGAGIDDDAEDERAEYEAALAAPAEAEPPVTA